MLCCTATASQTGCEQSREDIEFGVQDLPSKTSFLKRLLRAQKTLYLEGEESGLLLRERAVPFKRDR